MKFSQLLSAFANTAKQEGRREQFGNCSNSVNFHTSHYAKMHLLRQIEDNDSLGVLAIQLGAPP